MDQLGKNIRYLPRDLQCLELDLGYNFLGENMYNMKSLANGMKQLPNNQRYLRLILQKNELKECDIIEIEKIRDDVLPKLKKLDILWE